MYFEPPYTLEHINKQYRKLSMKLHTDKGGDGNEFIMMKHEYDVLKKVISENKIIGVPKGVIKKVRRPIKKIPVKKVVQINIDAVKLANQFFKQLSKLINER